MRLQHNGSFWDFLGFFGILGIFLDFWGFLGISWDVLGFPMDVPWMPQDFICSNLFPMDFLWMPQRFLRISYRLPMDVLRFPLGFHIDFHSRGRSASNDKAGGPGLETISFCR